MGGGGTSGAVGLWATGPETTTRVFGLRPAERMARCLPPSVAVFEGSDLPPAHLARHWFVMRSDVVMDERLTEALLKTRNVVLHGRRHDGAVAMAAHVRSERLADAAAWIRDGKPVESGNAELAGPDDLVHPYDARLRKRQPAILARATPEIQRDLEWALFRAAYKGVTDWVTRNVWPRPAFHVVRACAEVGITPNLITALSYGLVVGAFWAFLQGQFAAGLAMGWLMTFLDTVDGKLARVTLQSSRFGHVLDHGLDLVHPPFWWWAFGGGLVAAGATGLPVQEAAWICVGGYVVGRVLEGVFLAGFGFELHSYRKTDSVFRQFTARRNPNLVLLTVGVLAGRPELGLLATAGWTVASNLFHAVRIVQATWRRGRGLAITPWEEDAVTH